MPSPFPIPNDRIFYACQAVLSNNIYLEGVQSVGVNWNLTTEMLLDVGKHKQQKHRYGKPTYTVTISRVLPKSGNFFFSSSSHPLESAAIGTGPSPRTWDIALLYSADSQQFVNGTISKITYNNCRLTAIGYSITVDGPIKENITFECSSYSKVNTSIDLTSTLPQTGFTLKREDVTFTTLPQEVLDAFNIGNSLNGKTIYGLQSIEINVEINYRDVMDVGTWDDNFLLVEIPMSVTSSFTGIVRSHYDETRPNISDEYYNTNRTINIAANAGATSFRWNLGSDNYLTGFDFSGGDTEGGNVEATLSYQNDSSEFYFTKS
jgi:hypothetical protein